MIRKSRKKCALISYLYLNFLLIKFILCNFGVLEVAAITEQQRQEVEILRKELVEALDNESENVATKDIIVQPFWTQNGEKLPQRDSVNVQLNEENLNEATALRHEIEQAVAADKYATLGSARTADIKDLEYYLRGKGKDEKLEEGILGLGRTEGTDAGGKGPNVISAHIGDDSNIDIQKLQRLELSKRRTKEVLILKYVEEDFAFVFGAEVNEWKHIEHADQEYFIGRRITEFLIIRKQSGKYERAMMVDVGHIINYMETYTYWNLEREQQEGVILIAAEDKVLWYRTHNEESKIELYWDWMVGSRITGLTYFNVDSTDFLIVSTNRSFSAGYYALNIYQYKLETKEFWIVQRLQLAYPCEEVTVLNSGRDIILAIPQYNTAAIYTFNPHEATFSHIKFELKISLPAEGISTIAGFKMGGRSYLALTGYQPQILLYQQGNFVPKTLLDKNFGLVELFFPIPVRTYRDDLILLVQHRVDFITHTVTVVETLIWDGEAFVTSIPVPCHLGKHVVHGVGCMLDLQREEGLKGAALLKIGQDVSIVVPRYKAESGLFRFHTELLAKNSELLDLQEIFDFLKDWVKEQEDLVAQAETFLNIPNEELIQYQPDLTILESLKTPEFEFYGEVEEIYVNDYKWTLEDSNIDLEELIQNVENLDRSLNSGRQRRNQDDILYNELQFDEVIVEDLELQNLNGQKFYIQNGELNFDGLVEFSELDILEKFMNLNKRQVSDEQLVLEGDLEFSKINGIDWSDIRDNLIFTNQKQNLMELEVKGEVFVENLLNINTLNNLSFPDDYLLSNGPNSSVVTAEKHFSNILSAIEIDTNGLINNKSPMDAITLMDAQEWQGMPTFQQLEVLEIFELNDEKQARNVNTGKQNPTLRETTVVDAICHFNELTVNGPVVLKGNLNGKSLGSLLKDILLRPQDPTKEILVPSLKSFDLIKFPTNFNLENNTINQIPTNYFVTLNTNQTLNITSIEGYMYFYNLTLDGSYDGVKIEDILKEVILLEDPIDLSTTELIFSEELKAESISITDTINGMPIKDNLQTLQEDLNLKSVEFENLQAQQADFSQDILGEGKLNVIELHSFVNERTWQESPIRGNIFLNELILEKGIKVDELHGIRADYLLDFLNQIEDIPDMVLNGKILVDHIAVTGDVQVHKLNGLLFDEDIKLKTIALNRPNFLSNSFHFKSRLDIKGQLNVVGEFNGNHLPDIIDDIVVRSTDFCIDIKAPKRFAQPVEVLQNTHIKAWNGIPIENLAWKTKENHFQGSVHLKGNLVVRDIHLQGYINHFNWQDITKLIYFDEKLQNFVLKNTIEFNSPLYLEDLTVMGDLNDLPNITDFFENIIYKNQSCVLKGKNIFTGRVSIEGASIGNLNGQDLSYLFNNLVFIDNPQPTVVYTPITFEDSVTANELQVNRTLSIEHLNGCSIKEWLSNSLRVDQDQYVPHFLLFAAGTLDGNSFSVNFINDKDLTRIITLNTPQIFNETVNFSNVISNGFISAKGLVNNFDLEEEFYNTLMTEGHQHVTTPLNIQTVVVLGDLNIRGLVNGNKDMRDVATLQEDLILESPIYLQSVSSPQVIVKDLVGGIDFNKWFESVVKNQYPHTQYITGNWSTKSLKIKAGTNIFPHVINDFMPHQYNSFSRLARSEQQVDKEICQLIKQILEEIATKTMNIKCIEEDFNMNLGEELKSTNETLNKLFYLKSNQKHILLINVKCKTLVYKWLAAENKFIYENFFESGAIEEIQIIPAFNRTAEIQFVTKHTVTEHLNCSQQIINKWKIENDTIAIDEVLPEATDLLYKMHGNTTSLWVLYNETIEELDVEFRTKKKWQLPVEKNKTRYRFVPLEEQNEILLTNGEHLVLLSNQVENNLMTSSYVQELENNLNGATLESLLKPNSSLAPSSLVANFKMFIKDILIDLEQRFNQQINIIQLSIPESDLFDEHLVPDFLAIMHELQKQNIYPKELFDTSFDNITLPQDPAQVLAARVVQISWRAILKIQEIHTSLVTRANLNYTLYSRINETLFLLIKDVLKLANDQKGSREGLDKLTSVIQRIRIFNKQLKEFVSVLVNPINNQQKFSQIGEDLVYLADSHLPGYKQGEILTLTVGGITNRRNLWAVTNSKTSLIANKNPGIYIYLEGLNRQLHQVVAAIQPRSLQQLQIQHETFLLYIEACCQVQILRYYGLQGFANYAEIYSEEHIKQILTITLPYYQKNSKHFVILVFEKNIKFYELVFEGFELADATIFNHKALNCL